MVAILLTARPEIVLALDRDARILLAGAYLAGALLIAAAVIALVRRWWRAEEARPPSASDEMAHYRRLYEQGTISEEEYKRLRGLLGGELRRSVDLLPAKPPAPPNPAENSPSGPPGPSPEGPQPPPDGIQPA